MNINRYTKTTLLLVAMMTMMSNVAIVTTIPHLKKIFVDEQNIELFSRLMLTLPSLTIAILAPILGHFVNRIGKKKSAIVALILFSLFGSAGLYLRTIESLLISRALLGIAIATLMIVSTSLVGDYFKNEQRHKFMGLQSAFVAIGGVFFVVGGGFLSDISWHYPFGMYLMGFILLPLVLMNLKEKTNFNDEEDVSTPPNQKLLPIYILAFIFMAIFYILPTQIPFLMINEFNASGALTGSIISAAFLSNAVGSIAYSKIKTKLDYKNIYLLGLLIVSIGFILVSLFKVVYLFFISAMILGFGGGIMMTNVNAWMLSLAHHTKRVKSSGYLTSAFFLGQFFSPILTMPIVHYFGVQYSFFIIACIITISVIISFLYIRRKSESI